MLGWSFRKKGGKFHWCLKAENNSLLQGGVSEVQEEPAGLFSCHLPKDVAWWNFSAWAPVPGVGVLSSVSEQPCTRRLVFLTHCVHTAVQGIPNRCWHNPLENQRLFRAYSVSGVLLDTPEQVSLLFCVADEEETAVKKR